MKFSAEMKMRQSELSKDKENKEVKEDKEEK